MSHFQTETSVFKFLQCSVHWGLNSLLTGEWLWKCIINPCRFLSPNLENNNLKRGSCPLIFLRTRIPTGKFLLSFLFLSKLRGKRVVSNEENPWVRSRWVDLSSRANIQFLNSVFIEGIGSKQLLARERDARI